MATLEELAQLLKPDIFNQTGDMYNSPGQYAAPAEPTVDEQIATELAGSPVTNPGAGRWDEFTEGSIIQGTEPQHIDFSIEEVGQAPVAAGQRTGFSASRSASGFPGGPKGVDAQYADEEAKANAKFGQVAPQYDAQAERIGGQFDQIKDGASEEFDLSSQHWAKQAEIFDRLNDLNETYLEVAQKIHADGKRERETAMAGIREQLAGVRLLAQQDANPLHNTSTLEDIGLTGARFAQGFLKAGYGIDIDVAGSIDREVQRALQQHQQKIQNARAGVEDEVHLYEIARQNSQDDYEALMRYRAMVIESTKVKLEAEAARFNSPLAAARAKQKIAELEMQGDMAIMAVGERKQKAFVDLQMLGLKRAKENGELKLRKEAQGIAAYNAQTARMGELRQQKKDDREATMDDGLTIQDPSQVKLDEKGNVASGGKIIAKISPKNPNFKYVTGAQQLFGAINSGTAHLRKLKAKLDSTGGPEWYKRATSEEFREWEKARNLVANTIRKHMSGAASSDVEMKQYMDLLEGDKWLQVGGNDSLMDNIDTWGRQYFSTAMQAPGVVAVSGDNYAERVQVDPAGEAKDKIRLSTDAPIVGFGAKMVETAYLQDKQQVAAGPAWRRFMKQMEYTDGGPRVSDMKTAPMGAMAVNYLVEGVLNPGALKGKKDRFGAELPDSEEEIVKQSIEGLITLSQGAQHASKGGGGGGYAAQYANSWLELIKSDEEEALWLYRQEQSELDGQD